MEKIKPKAMCFFFFMMLLKTNTRIMTNHDSVYDNTLNTSSTRKKQRIMRRS